jgi:Asp-tRNA(Asn)/Glu-tRNA(Gln) amidotransferase B subunit
MHPSKIEIGLERRPLSTTTISSHLIHMEQDSEEEVHVPFTFVDVNVSHTPYVVYLLNISEFSFFLIWGHK